MPQASKPEPIGKVGDDDLGNRKRAAPTLGSQHARTDSSAPSVPEPSFAEQVRTLLHLGRTGTLSSMSRKHPGWPFGSVMPYALDDHGRPVFLISVMAMHTQNLKTDPRASLLVSHPGWTGDPLAGEKELLRARDLGARNEDWLLPLARAWADQGEHARIIDEIVEEATMPRNVRAMVNYAHGLGYLGLNEPAAAEKAFSSTTTGSRPGISPAIRRQAATSVMAAPSTRSSCACRSWCAFPGSHPGASRLRRCWSTSSPRSWKPST